MLRFGYLDHCQDPIWQVDDVSECVQQKYLKFILPLGAVAISWLLLLFSLGLNRRVRSQYLNIQDKKNSNGHSLFIESHEGDNSLIQDNNNYADDEGLSFNGARLVRCKTISEQSYTIVDKPFGQYKALSAEIFAVVVLDALNIAGLATRTAGAFGTMAAIAGVITWTYIAIIVFYRLALTITGRNLSSLWKHTLMLYMFMWLISLIIFRSAIIHPRPRIAQVTAIVEFLFTSLLFLISITTRKGNKTVFMEWENNIEPSRELLASILSIATFSWVDAIVWKGYRKIYELPGVWNLVPQDKAALVLADFRQLQKTTALSWHLLRYFKEKLVIQCMFGIISAFFTFAPTLLLKSILEYIENPNIAPRNVIWLFVILLAFTDILRSFADGQALWIGRKICIRLRAIIIGEIYAKALRRKAASGSETILGDRKRKEKLSRPGLIKKFFRTGKKGCDKTDSDGLTNDAVDAAEKPKDEQTNVGTIINLMSVDAFNVSEITAYLHFLLAAAPSQLIIATYLLYQILGYSSIPGLIVMVILLPINIILARGFGQYQKRIMTATDKRIQITNEVLQNIRIIKYFAWEQRFAKTISEKRRVELKALQSKYILWASAVAVWNTVPIVITFFSFLVYTTVEGKPLYPSIAFTAISLFNILRVPLDQLGDMIAHVLESKVSVDRVEEFLNEEETDKYNQLGHDNIDEHGNRIIGFREATVTWGLMKEDEEETAPSFRLMNLNIQFKIGSLNIISGPTGSGKTSLLMALLGEMKLLEGRIFLPGGNSREDVRPDLETGLSETVAYCAQQAWLVNANIKDNILFATSYDEKRYKDVIFACALERDLQVLANGDQTLVGEKGITLSGGQKQRISLARALYSNSKHLLLDDCLSAVDSHSAKWVFQNCIRGPLMKGRTCILVTHNLALCLPQSQFAVIMNNGRVEVQGNPHDIIATGKLGEEISKAITESIESLGRPSRVSSNLTSENSENTLTESPNIVNILPRSNQEIDAMKETKAEGGVKLSVLFLYLKSMGPWWFWVIAVLIFGVQQLGSLVANAWIRQWANQYSTESTEFYNAPNSFILQNGGKLTAQNTGTPTLWLLFFNNKESSSVLNEVQGVNITYYLTIYAAIGFSCMLVALFRDLWLFFGSLTASWRIHQRLVQSVVRAKFKFFDVTPLGQMMNRFSKDLEAIDQELAPVSIGVMSCALAILVTISLITFITPGFLIAAVLICCLYVFVSMFYLKSSRDLKRLESIQRSPLFQHFGETLSGITTIRAFRDERRFIRDNLQKINTHNRPFIFLWSTNRWLAIRMDIIGDLVSFAAGAFVVLSIGRIDPGSAGLSLSYAISFTENVLWLVRLYAINEQNMNSVERIKEYVEVEQEAGSVTEGIKPPTADWPSQGSVEFINYTTKYRADLDPVLKDLSFKVNPGEKIGIVGRTGAGKSSLALALFRGLEAEEGKILVDDIDISLIDLQNLRESITIVPQDPTLFSGTIRTNLDPFDLYSDDKIFDSLRRVHLIESEDTATVPTPHTTSQNEMIEHISPAIADNSHQISKPTPVLTNKNIFLNLLSPVVESGSNLSQGQRQLLCLARAMLKNPKVLLMDEATASIDYLTDSKIQKTIRELKSTTITIAHRLQTIVDYDKVLVLDQGKVIEFGHPWILLQEKNNAAVVADISKSDYNTNRTGLFRDMCETSGDMDTLAKTAKKAWDAGRLVDLE